MSALPSPATVAEPRRLTFPAAVGVPARVVRIAGKKVTDNLDHVHVPDPVAQEFCRVEHRLHALEKKLRQYEEAEAAKAAADKTTEEQTAAPGKDPSADA